MKKVDKTLYDADSIQSLSPREHIRKRSGMYIGNNQIIHASNERTGIKISYAYYRTPIKIGRVIR